jgi:glucose-6-phosphate 1-dehydrogenase
MANKHDQPARGKGEAADDDTEVAPPCAMVIFGAAGDLTKRLVVPALYNLVNAKRLPKGFRLVGVDLAFKSTEEWRKDLGDMMTQFVAQGGGEFQADHIDQMAWRWLTHRMTYLQGDLTDAGTYDRLQKHLGSWTRPPARRATTSSILQSRTASSAWPSAASGLGAW